jgi:hypothetical protein
MKVNDDVVDADGGSVVNHDLTNNHRSDQDSKRAFMFPAVDRTL